MVYGIGPKEVVLGCFRTNNLCLQAKLVILQLKSARQVVFMGLRHGLVTLSHGLDLVCRVIKSGL